MLYKRNLIFADEIGNRKSGAQLRLRIRVPAVHTTRIAGGSFFYSMENQKSLSVVDHENRPRISMEDVGQRHFFFPLLQNNNVTPTSLIQVKTKPYLHVAFRHSLHFPPLGNQQSDAHSQQQHRIHLLLSAYIDASFPTTYIGTA